MFLFLLVPSAGVYVYENANFSPIIVSLAFVDISLLESHISTHLFVLIHSSPISIPITV